ncbi:ankyrin repeat-containing domain protein [Aspergillus insuetus]
MNTLPAELILEIVTHLEFTRDIAALSQTNRALHHRLNARVYAHNCQHENGLGLEHAVKLNISSAVAKLLSHGAGRKLPRPGFVRLLTETAMGHTSLDIICMLRQHSIDSDGDGDGDNALPLPRCTADWMVKQCGIPLSEAINEDKYSDPRYMAHYQDAELLDTAIQYDRVDVVRMLIAEGVQPSVHGDCALVNAAAWSSAELVEVLLESGCDTDVNGNGRDEWASGSALHSAVSAGKVDNVRILLRAGADLEESNVISGTPLCLAVERGFREVVQILVEAGAVLEPLSEGVALTPLLRAAERGHGAVAEYLLEKVDIDSIIQSEGEEAAAGRLSLLAVSSTLGYTDLAERILAAGHDVNIPPEWPGPLRTTRSMLSFAAEHGHIGLVMLVMLFLRHGAEFCPEGDGGFYQALACAVRGGHEAIVRILLEAGAPTDIPLDDAETTILNVSTGTPRIAQVLLDHGATPGPPVLLAALSTGNLALVRQLLLRRISLHDFNPVEPVLNAAASGGRAALELLRRHGIGPDPDDTDTEHPGSPLEVAIRKGAVDTVRYCLFEVAARGDFGFATFLGRNASSLLCAAICDLHGEECVEMLETLISSLSTTASASAPASLSSSSSSSSTTTNTSSPRAEKDYYTQSLTRALHVAIPRYHRAAVGLLLSKGADLDWRDGAEKKNAWDLAYDRRDRVMLELLLEHAYAQVVGEDADVLRRYILPVEQKARREGHVVAVKAISYFCWRRMYPVP